MKHDQGSPLKPADELQPMTVGEFLEFLTRDLIYLDGVADALESQTLRNKLHGMRRNVRAFRTTLAGKTNRDVREEYQRAFAKTAHDEPAQHQRPAARYPQHPRPPADPDAPPGSQGD